MVLLACKLLKAPIILTIPLHSAYKLNSRQNVVQDTTNRTIYLYQKVHITN